MAMIMPRNKYVSDKHGLYHLYLALGGFCAAYKFVCSTSRSIISLPNVMSKTFIAVAVLSMSIGGQMGSLNVTGNMGEEPVEEVVSLACGCSDSEEGKSQCRCGLSAVYGRTPRLSLHCLPPAEGESSRHPRLNWRRNCPSRVRLSGSLYLQLLAVRPS